MAVPLAEPPQAEQPLPPRVDDDLDTPVPPHAAPRAEAEAPAAADKPLRSHRSRAVLAAEALAPPSAPDPDAEMKAINQARRGWTRVAALVLTTLRRHFMLLPSQELVLLGKSSRWRDALTRFDTLCERGPAPNVHVCTTAISIAARNAHGAAAAKGHAYMRRAGVAPTTHTYTALVRARGNTGDWRGALALLDDMDASGCVANGHTAAALLAACARGGADGATAAVPLFQRIASSLPPSEVDAHIVSCFITLFGRLGDAAGAQRVWSWAASAGVVADAHTQCAYLTALLRAGAAPAAARHFRSLRAQAAASTHVTAAGMRALAAVRAPTEEVQAALDALVAAGGAPSPHCYAALLAAHARAGDAAAALRLLEDMRAGKAGAPPPTLVCANLALSACANGGEWREADALLRALRAGPPELRPDVVSYSTAMLASAAAGEAALAEQQYEALLADEVAPNDYTFTALISAHGAAARAAVTSAGGAAAAAASLRAALGCRGRMASAGVAPSVHTFNALIEAADAARDWGAALRVHAAMRVSGVPPNAVTHALMAVVGQRGADDVAAAQTRLAAVSAAAATLAAALIQKGLL